MTSIPIPESAERRAEISRSIMSATGLDEATLQRFVRTFYETARADPEIGPLFANVHDWDRHISRITDFWSSVALMTGRYHGQPLMAHYPLGLRPPHFARWLQLFEVTAQAVCPPEGAALLTAKAHRIARSLELGVAVQRGELP